MGPAAGGGVRLGEVQRRHAEQPVGVDQFVQLLRAGGREGLAVAAGAVRAGGEGAQGGLGLVLGHLAQHAVDQAEQPVLVAGVADEQVDVPAGAVGQRLPGGGRQDVAVDDGCERDRPRR